MSVVWRKVWRDLARNRARTFLVVISTAVGVFALGLVFGLSGVMRARLTEAHRESKPAHITFWGGPFSPAIVDALRRERGVAAVEGVTVAGFRWKRDGDRNWRQARVIARDDYDAQRMNLLRLQDGHWPTKRVLGVDRLSSRHFDVRPGTSILVEVGQRGRRVPVVGVVHAHDILSPEWGGEVTFFATPETAAWLTGYEQGEDFNQLRVVLDAFSQEVAGATAERIEERLERIGLVVAGYEVTDPNVHWMQDMVDTVMIVLAVMGALSLGLSAFLIINTMNAIIARQVWQIGVMKAFGATIVRVVDVYLATALIYGGLALMLAVPLGVIGAHLASVWLLDMFNVEVATFQFEPAAVALQVAIGVAVPLLAALVPVLGGARTTVRQAISTHGIGTGFGRGWLDRLIGHVRRLPRMLALSLRNAFRRKTRVVLTLATLTLSGAVFTVVMSTGDSLDNTFKIIFELEGDVSVALDRPHRISRLIEIAEGVPGVTRAEVWDGQQATLALRSGEEHPVSLVGVPGDSAMFAPRIVTGRGLAAADANAVLLDNAFAEEEALQPGDEITLNIGGAKSEWTVAGSYMSLNTLSTVLYVPRDALGRETATFGRGTAVKVRSEAHDVASQERLIAALTEALAAEHIEMTDTWSAGKQWEESHSAFSVLIYLLLAMAILTAVVGSIGLMSTMSINVVERAREIGVMRAIGATSRAVAAVFVVEGVFVGVLSWLLALPLSLPGARLFSDVIGEAVLRVPLDFEYSAGGVILWLLIVAVLSALASLWPALQATRVSVREALAYE